MNSEEQLEIFLTAVPGLEPSLLKEVREKGFNDPESCPGGVTIRGGWPDVWRANLALRGASKVLVRLGTFRALHLAQLDKKVHKFPWGDILRPDVPVKVDVTAKKSRIYHSKAAAERIERALTETFGATVSEAAEVVIKVRIHDDNVTISVDTSGEGLHKRGHKKAVNKAPLRETLAALLLRECAYLGRETVVDPMCGSGTFILEAADIAAGLMPGRSRSFAFEQLATFDPEEWKKLRKQEVGTMSDHRFYGFDRDAGAVKMSMANAERAGTSTLVQFQAQPISELKAPEGKPGLVIINPPYGIRIGDEKDLLPLYQSLGKALSTGFKGWRIGLITNSHNLAKATGLPFNRRITSFSHGGITVKLYKTVQLK